MFWPAAFSPDEDLERMPGLFRRWELTQLLEPGQIYRIENAGTTEDGSPLFAVYRRIRGKLRETPVRDDLQ